jgi:uncharacterized protein (UPF0548 family)
VTVLPLPRALATRLAAEPFTYPEVGATRGSLPVGYDHVRESRRLSSSDFDDVTARLLSWDMHVRAGFEVAASDVPLREGSVVSLRTRVGPLKVAASCRVVCVVDEPTRRGFAYGTLPGHPESGEESFVVEQLDDGSLVATITAFSRPASFLAKLAGPIGRRLQADATRRYLDAIEAGS